LHAIGRLLLELLHHGFAAPSIWNIKGNEFARRITYSRDHPRTIVQE